MKKIALLSAAATAATLAFTPAAFADTAPTQKLVVKLTSAKAGTKKKPKSVGITVTTGTTNQTDTPNKTKFTITDAKIFLPKGIKLNYKAFPACDLPAAETQNGAYCATNAPKAAIGSGSATASVVDIDTPAQGTLTPFIGTNGRLIIRTAFDSPAVIDQPLIGNISTAGGGYSFGFHVPNELQTPLENADQQISDFTLKFKAKTAKKGSKKIGLVELNSCPKGGYVFKGEFTFKNIAGTTLAETTVPCKQGK